ncbi:endonuclease/exonuclease/phosphatase family protein [Corynebacterium aquilae]|uniref:Endonuclease/exonuclease/phosphatase domain-containing protein n=1 Tax=Corynebacterium aquilae DSM 44791 TaxID=1431546 RepID=A0A1L7CHE2_9CORY|nr:endonuclease/exonuclease/phosphatase family protein [Corynebacterium aquilae]APT85282.1 hypothetical protein CAQU_09600 [Corynebacterium aquilae DSM 44791]
MKLLTLNAHAWLESEQVDKIARLAEFIVDRDVDVVALQEVNQLRRAPKTTAAEGFVGGTRREVRADNYALVLRRFLKELSQSCWQWAWVDAHIGFDKYDEGVAVLSRRPIAEVVALPHSTVYDYDNVRRRMSVAARVDAGVAGREVWVVSGHFSWWRDPAFGPATEQGFPLGQPHQDADEFIFRAEWNHLLPQLERLRAQAPVVLAGDFNNAASVRGEGYDLVTAGGMWRDSFLIADETLGEATVHKRIAGWQDNVEALRIDYVFVSAGLGVHSHEVVFADDSSCAVSDHSGILVQIHVGEERCGV